jgi:hypothetical protein
MAFEGIHWFMRSPMRPMHSDALKAGEFDPDAALIYQSHLLFEVIL